MMDRSLSGAAQVEEMLSMLSPTGKVSFFGAPRLASAVSSRRRVGPCFLRRHGTAPVPRVIAYRPCWHPC